MKVSSFIIRDRAGRCSPDEVLPLAAASSMCQRPFGTILSIRPICARRSGVRSLSSISPVRTLAANTALVTSSVFCALRVRSSRHSPGGSRRLELPRCQRPGLHPDRDLAHLPPDGGGADLDGQREFSVPHQSVDRRAAQSRYFLNLSASQQSVIHVHSQLLYSFPQCVAGGSCLWKRLSLSLASGPTL